MERWILGACATWPKPEGTPDIQATLLYAGLTLAGAMQLRDFEGLTSTEAMAIWPHLGDTPMGFVDHLFLRFTSGTWGGFGGVDAPPPVM